MTGFAMITAALERESEENFRFGEFFHTRDGRAFVDLVIGGHQECLPVWSNEFRRWLERHLYESAGRLPTSTAVRSIVRMLDCRAHEGPEREVYIRVDVPTRFKGPLYETNAVWFTTEPQPEGHGLGEAGTFTEEMRRVHFEKFGILPPEGSRFANKKAVRITVVIPSSDRRLVRWLTWGHKHCEPGFYDALAKGNHHKTWWLYFGIVAPDQFRAIDYLRSTGMSTAIVG